MRYLLGFICALALGGLGLLGCGDDAGPGDAPAMIDVLVTNDDGIGAEGIDALVEALRAEPMVQVTVVAPAADQSGTSDMTTDGPVSGTSSMTASGFAGTAVDGFPADCVIYALEEVLDEAPDLVVSGVNAGQNVGAYIDGTGVDGIITGSGTIGAARTAARCGIPAVAVSQGDALLILDGIPPDFPAGVEQALAWFRANRDAAAAGTLSADTITNINIPTCSSGGAIRGVEDVPPTTSWPTLGKTQDCLSTLTEPANDVEAFEHGFVAVSDVSLGDTTTCQATLP